MKYFTQVCLLLFCSCSLFSQSLTITGVVTDAEDGSPLIGANVFIENTTTGTTTDFDGNYTLSANSGDVLEFSYVGYKTQTVVVGATTTIDVVLSTDVASLGEVVVIGYGTQKKADLTGAISQLDDEDLQSTPASNVNQTLQGKIAGVQVTSTGTPGASADVKLRGVGTYTTDPSPLYVVDGMYFDNIDFLNPSDIKSLNVLKDASSTAIFGVKASGGVIIIETFSGRKNQKPQITYNGYYGVQNAQNVLKMANAEQFTTMAYESGSQADIDNILNAMQRYGRSRINPNIPDVNTDWYKEILQTAPITNHNLTVTGGSENISYSIGGNYFGQDGLLSVVDNNFERINFRSRIDVKVTDRLDVGTNLIYSNSTQQSAENGVWNQIYFATPILPIYDPNNTVADPIDFANAKDIGFRGTQNPFPTLQFNNNRVKRRSILAGFYAQYAILPELTFKTSYNTGYKPFEERFVNLSYQLGENDIRPSSISTNNGSSLDQIWDNTLTYTTTRDLHDITLLAGTSYRDEAFSGNSASGSDIIGEDNEDNWNVNNTDQSTRNAGSYSRRIYAMSYFGRAQYGYDNRYLINATIRAEGISKYTKNRWGYFPSVGLGWVISEESFMKNSSAIDFLKLRASWGRNGNDKVAASSGSNTVSNVSVAINDIQSNGTTVSSTYSDLEWEYMEETDVGITASFLNDRLSLDADYFIRQTKKAVIPVYQPLISLYVNQNAGVLENSGFELTARWRQRTSDKFSYSLGANFATLRNKVVDIYNQEYIDGGSAEFRQRSIVGEPIRAFFGYKIAGIYQNQSEIDSDPIAVANSLEPGDIKYVDQNNDGVLDAEDRVILGSYLPKLTYGFDFSMSYGALDFSIDFYGQSGNKILNRKRGEIIWTPDLNMDADLAINRWHGEGTSDFYPSSKGLRKGWNQRLSDFFIEDGSYFRIQNVQLGYNITDVQDKGIGSKIIFTAERPYTSFGYNGFTPEVNDGIDSQTYPIPAVYTVGLNLTF